MSPALLLAKSDDETLFWMAALLVCGAGFVWLMVRAELRPASKLKPDRTWIEQSWWDGLMTFYALAHGPTGRLGVAFMFGAWVAIVHNLKMPESTWRKLIPEFVEWLQVMPASVRPTREEMLAWVAEIGAGGALHDVANAGAGAFLDMLQKDDVMAPRRAWEEVLGTGT